MKELKIKNARRWVWGLHPRWCLFHHCNENGVRSVQIGRIIVEIVG